jgi:hypothetical protein
MRPDMPISAKKQTSADPWSNLPFIAIGAVAFFIMSANLFFIIYRVRLPYPIDQWEAGIVADAWRMLQGQAIYATGTDHATHMYGPLTTVVLAHAFEFTGPALEVGRLVNTISGIAVVVLLAAIFGGSDRLTFAVSIALLLAANGRTEYYFVQTRPDMVSAFFATLALIVLYHAQEPKGKAPRRVAIIIAGSALLVIAVMFKQTAGAFVFVPALAMLAKPRKFSFRNQFLFATIPIVGLSVTLGAIWYLAPGLWHFLIEVPGQYKYSVLTAGQTGASLLSLPLFVLASMHWLLTDARDNWQMLRVRWLMAAMICAIVVSLAAVAKDGGVDNSLIPALLAIGAFCAWRTPVAFAFLRDNSRPLSLRIGTGILFGILLFGHAYPNSWPLDQTNLKEGYGGDARALVIAEAHELPGKVVCPDDPAIPLMAKGYAGRTAVFESDAIGLAAAGVAGSDWGTGRVQAVLKEIDSADYVITVMPDGASPDTPQARQDLLQAHGFIKSEFRTTSSPVYELWQRARPQAFLPHCRTRRVKASKACTKRQLWICRHYIASTGPTLARPERSNDPRIQVAPSWASIAEAAAGWQSTL